MSSPATKRVFLGLSVDGLTGEGVRRESARAFEEAGPVAVYDADDLHLTLAFLGALDADAVRRVEAAARSEFAGLWAPELTILGRGGAFPADDAPRAVWRSIEEAQGCEGRLDALRNRAWQVGLSAGWRPGRAERERPFRPHVTVARPRAGADVGAAALRDLGRDRRWLPLDVTLYESLGARAPVNGESGERSDGPRYRVLAAWPLAVQPER